MDDLRAPSDLKLLADPTRARIVQLILDSPDGRQRVGELATELQLRQPTVSHHVKALLDQGLLERHPDGRRVWYSLAEDRRDRVHALVPGETERTVEPEVLERISSDLALRFSGTFSRETVDRYVAESFALLSTTSQLTSHVASLTATFTADRLSALATQNASPADLGAMPRVPEVLFVCVQNAGRSQLAAGILRHLAGDRVHVRTAGSAPAAAMRSVIVTALDEIGVPVGGEYPKPLTDEVVRAADVVITMGCGDACPVYPGRTYLDWSIDDPDGQPLAGVRVIRDDIETRVRALLSSLVVNDS
ncbi:metalloregulator ArsR/SmtB family transcription factor [Subtercola sp. PAMC28395]|uniref:metalloregulator ArsR/SmtB family transcription factor n=1 Tax=Subtercola sp. PAMC28395 TaxID=2846775 RepID=UPI001C0D562A|nr:metalloregulator ArsR/SmtB family transcription factor [Subtercola sp. PAMC28395]QWT23303.1 metalloregulator ArsR/SmtB family transcription factor [Subtercola sp. PAMC28395]